MSSEDIKKQLHGRSFLTLMDYSTEEIRYLLDLAHDLKAGKKAGRIGDSLRGKNVVLLFDKTSTRTRCAFEVAVKDEGGSITFLDKNSSQMGKKESLEDTAKVLGRMFDAIEYRGFKQSVVEDLAKYSGVPVWNGLTDVDHPTQILADMMTIEEHYRRNGIRKKLAGSKVVFCGDIRNNMSYAWMYGACKMGIHYVAYGPDEMAAEIDGEVLAKTREEAEKNGGSIEISSDPACLEGADAIYTDIWASMGEEDEIPERVRLLSDYRVTSEMLESTGNEDVIFLHCLPSFHDFETDMAKAQKELGYDIREVTDEVFLGPHSLVFDEAENRMHTIKAVCMATLGK